MTDTNIINTFDYTQKVPGSAISFMIGSIVIALVITIIVMRFFQTKFDGGWQPLFMGIVSYLLGVVILSNLLQVLFLNVPQIAIAFANSPNLERLVNVICNSVIQLVVLYICLYLLSKYKSYTLGNMLVFAVGFCLVELVITVIGIFMNVMVVTLINSSDITTIVQGLETDVLTTTLQGFQELIDTPPANYLLTGIERIVFLVLQTSVVVMLFTSIKNAGKYLYVILGFCFVLSGSMMGFLYTANILTNAYIADALLALIAIVAALIAVNLIKKYFTDDYNHMNMSKEQKQAENISIAKGASAANKTK